MHFQLSGMLFVSLTILNHMDYNLYKSEEPDRDGSGYMNSRAAVKRFLNSYEAGKNTEGTTIQSDS